MKRILITGASGMVGKHLLKSLKSKKNILISPTKKELNLLDKKLTIKYISRTKPDIIIHCAAIVGGILFNKNNQTRMLSENLEINNNLINTAYNLGIKRLINFSSSCVYPNTNNKHKEKEIFDGNYEKTNEGYALSKFFSMKLCKFINEDQKFKYKTLIPCNLYGPGDTFDPKRSHLISSAIIKVSSAKKNRDSTVVIWGSGKVKREFLFCSDLANFVKFSLHNFNKIPDFINVGTKTNLSVLDYYKLICKTVNYYPKFKFDKSKPDGVYQKKLDTSLQNKLKWKNEVDISTGLKQTYNFYLKHYAKN